jgi:hypothetical protein
VAALVYVQYLACQATVWEPNDCVPIVYSTFVYTIVNFIDLSIFQ